MQEFGIGSRVDQNKANDYYQKAAEKGNPAAQLRLAKIFLTEFDMFGNIQAPEATATLSVSKSLGENQKMALKMFKQAASSENPEALATLGHIYETGGYEDEKTGKFFHLLKKNIEKAMPLYAQAAEKHGSETAFNLSLIHI